MNYLTDSSATACGWKFPDYTSFNLNHTSRIDSGDT